jgi:hypothetical protein
MKKVALKHAGFTMILIGLLACAPVLSQPPSPAPFEAWGQKWLLKWTNPGEKTENTLEMVTREIRYSYDFEARDGRKHYQIDLKTDRKDFSSWVVEGGVSFDLFPQSKAQFSIVLYRDISAQINTHVDCGFLGIDSKTRVFSGKSIQYDTDIPEERNSVNQILTDALIGKSSSKVGSCTVELK